MIKRLSEESNSRRIVIPEEYYTILETSIEEKSAIVVVNSNLRSFKHKDLFGWTCSLIMELQQFDCVHRLTSSFGR